MIERERSTKFLEKRFLGKTINPTDVFRLIPGMLASDHEVDVAKIDREIAGLEELRRSLHKATSIWTSISPATRSELGNDFTELARIQYKLTGRPPSYSRE